jgi:hypothetical protein
MINSKAEKCLFCGKTKTWKSEIVLFIGSKPYHVTVCPEDREKHTIKEIYTEIANQSMQEMKKVLAVYDAKRKAYSKKVLKQFKDASVCVETTPKEPTT